MKNQLDNDVIERPVEPTCRREFEGLKPPTFPQFPKNRKVQDIDQRQTNLSIVKSYKNSINFLKKNSEKLNHLIIGLLVVGTVAGLHHFMSTTYKEKSTQRFAESNLKTAYNTINKIQEFSKKRIIDEKTISDILKNSSYSEPRMKSDKVKVTYINGNVDFEMKIPFDNYIKMRDVYNNKGYSYIDDLNFKSNCEYEKSEICDITISNK